MRICSLLPSATEIVFDLGLGEALVGVSHTCDYPPVARERPVLTRSLRNRRLVAGETPIHAASADGVATTPSYALDGDLLRALRPDVILTQDICEVCAIGSQTVFEVVAQVLGYTPEFVTIQVSRLEDILESIVIVGEVAGVAAVAERRVEALRTRVAAVRQLVAATPLVPRVLCLEWARPLIAAGLWTAELVGFAGGFQDLTTPGAKSRRLVWDELADFAPDQLLFMPCGYDLDQARAEWALVAAEAHWSALPAVQAGQVYCFDGRVPSRHGPRTVDVLEAFAEILHPERCPPRWRGSLYEAIA
jgi:iron complex transport system substrate-binding protein